MSAFKRGQNSRIAVAFSGGPDSSALALIASLYNKHNSLSPNEECIQHADPELVKSREDSRQKSWLESNESLSAAMDATFGLEWRPLHVRMLDHLQGGLRPLEVTQSSPCLSSKEEVLALIVDHGLRPESLKEAHQAASIATEIGLVPTILTIDWGREGPEHVKKQHRMQRARNERYKVLLQKCIKEKVKILLVAHHAEDVIEGFLMRLLRGSGIDGLAGMDEILIQRLSDTQEDEVVIFRPFLSNLSDSYLSTCKTRSGATKKELVECLKENGISWIEDSSNFDTSYFRVKMRNFLKEMEQRNPTMYSTFVSDVLRVGTVCKRIRHEQESQTWNLFKTALVRHNMKNSIQGSSPCIEFDISDLRAAGGDLNKRLFTAVVRTLRPSKHPPAGQSLHALTSAVSRGPLSRSFQVGGCLFRELYSSNTSIPTLRITPQDTSH